MFKRKTKPAHVRLQTHTHTSAHWLSRTHPAREKREAEGEKNTKEWKHTHSLLSNDTRLEENLDKTRQSGKNWSVWWFDIHAEQTPKQRSGPKLCTVSGFSLKSTNARNDLHPQSARVSLRSRMLPSPTGQAVAVFCNSSAFTLTLSDMFFIMTNMGTVVSI